MPLLLQGLLDRVDLDAAQHRERDRGLLEPALAREAVDFALAEMTGAPKRHHLLARGRVTVADLSALVANPADHLGEHVGHRGAVARLFHPQPLTPLRRD